MKAVKTTVGRCNTANCGEPAAYARLLAANRRFLYCEKHVPPYIKQQAEEAAAKQAEQTKK